MPDTRYSYSYTRTWYSIYWSMYIPCVGIKYNLNYLHTVPHVRLVAR